MDRIQYKFGKRKLNGNRHFLSLELDEKISKILEYLVIKRGGPTPDVFSDETRDN